MKHNDWTDRLHDRLSDYKAVPPVGLWDKIETAVDGRRKRARTVRMRVWAAAAAVALLLISGAGYLLKRNVTSVWRECLHVRRRTTYVKTESAEERGQWAHTHQTCSAIPAV